MPLTDSETLFEKFCDMRSIRYRRVAVGTDRTPDYDILLRRFKIVTEVKEIRLNVEERKAEEDWKRGISTVLGEIPGDRVRKKISEAGPQIRSRANGGYPGLLVLFDCGFAAEHISEYNILVAMYGLETIQLAVPSNAEERPYAIGRKFGGRRKMTSDHNTSISAVAALTSSKKNGIQLEVFHNAYAAKPIETSLFAHYGVPQYRLGKAGPDHAAQWSEVSHATQNAALRMR